MNSHFNVSGHLPDPQVIAARRILWETEELFTPEVMDAAEYLFLYGENWMDIRTGELVLQAAARHTPKRRISNELRHYAIWLIWATSIALVVAVYAYELLTRAISLQIFQGIAPW